MKLHFVLNVGRHFNRQKPIIMYHKIIGTTIKPVQKKTKIKEKNLKSA